MISNCKGIILIALMLSILFEFQNIALVNSFKKFQHNNIYFDTLIKSRKALYSTNKRPTSYSDKLISKKKKVYTPRSPVDSINPIKSYPRANAVKVIHDEELYDSEDSKLPANNPWKTLIKKLDSSDTKASLGKIKNMNDELNLPVIDELKCQHFETCGGCTIKGNFTNIPIVQKAKLFFRSEKLQNFTVNIGETHGWRTHVKLAVQPLSKWGGLQFGLYRPGTHNVESIPECQVHHPKINEAVELLKIECNSLGIKGYESAMNGRPASGELRYIQLTLDRKTLKIQLVLVWNAMTYKECEQTLPRLIKKLKSTSNSIWHSITVNFQTSGGNAIFNYHPKSWKLLWGENTLIEKIGNANFYFKPQIFRQANLDAFEKGIIPTVERYVFNNSTIGELYSGIGVLGLNVAHKAKSIYCSDSNEYVDEIFDLCVDSLPLENQDKLFYENLAAEDAIIAGQCDNVDIMIVDPPRKGLDTGVINLLTDKHESNYAENLKRLIYVSCGFDALQRDIG